MNKWRKIENLLTYSGKGITPKYVEESSIIVLNQKCIRNHKIDYSFSRYTNDTKVINPEKFIQKGDILFNSTGQGTAGRCAFVDWLPENKKVITDSHILILRLENYFEAQCLSYSFHSIEKEIMSFMDGSTGQGELDKIRVFNLLTSLTEDKNTQKQIAKVLSDLDAKIAINNNINQELEAMAKTIYDYWFVQFDFPDANGKPYKSSGGKMAYNDELKREIPEGWESGTFETISAIIGGSTPSKAVSENFTTNKHMSWITPKDLSLNKGKKFITRGELDVTELGIKSASLKIMPKDTVLLSSRAPIGYLAISREDVTTNQGFKSFVPKEDYSAEFIYYCIYNQLPKIEAYSSGSTFKEVSSSTLKTIKISIPNQEVLNEYYKISRPIFKKQNLLELENQKLSELRDWLLPMLMNGQVTVGEAEEQLGMVAESGEKY